MTAYRDENRGSGDIGRGDGVAPTVGAAQPSHWVEVSPDRLLSDGHGAGDVLQAHEWIVLEEREGYLRIDAHMPDHLLNPKGQLFGGFTGAIVDLASLHAMRAGRSRLDPVIEREFMATINMRIDYYEPIVGPRFIIEAEVEHRRGKNALVVCRMFQDGMLAAYAITTMRAAGPLPPTA